jgi:hypothetical protein
MGYESRLYIVRKTDIPAWKDKKEKFNYAETMATYEMGVFPPFQILFNKEGSETKHFICVGDKEVIKDMYGDPLREASLIDVIDCLGQGTLLNDGASRYRKIKPLMALLQEFHKIENDYYQLAVFHYGH